MNEELPKFSGDVLLSKIAKLAKGLTYISETDANIVPFSAGPATTVDASSVTDDQTKLLSVRELSSEDYFRRLTARQDWYGEKGKQDVDKQADPHNGNADSNESHHKKKASFLFGIVTRIQR